MNQEFFNHLESALSSDRLDSYRQDGVGPAETMGRYLWNIALCQSLYAPLQMCEVALRNAIHREMTTLYSPNWFETVRLTDWALQQIANAKSMINKFGRGVISGRLVSELHLGFWTSLFDGYYERLPDFLARTIKKIFPAMANSQRNRKNIKDRLDQIRKLRNRVFHHERIIHWKDLCDQHAHLIETIGWISPEVAELALKLDRFLETYRAGLNPWIEALRNHWPAPPTVA